MKSAALCRACLILATLVPGSQAQVPQLDLKRFVGEWYQIARYPDKAEKRCVGDAITLYAEGNKPFQFATVNSCKIKDGSADVVNKNGSQDKSGRGILKVRTIFPFSKKYEVLALGPDYEWALVGTANHKILWVLSRTPKLEPEVYADVKAKAAAAGFDAGKVILTPQER